MTTEKQNKEGLTLNEWTAAAGYGEAKYKPFFLLKAWHDGEDPCDHRKAKEDKAFKDYEKKHVQARS
jgi:hypothetical protein